MNLFQYGPLFAPDADPTADVDKTVIDKLTDKPGQGDAIAKLTATLETMSSKFDALESRAKTAEQFQEASRLFLTGTGDQSVEGLKALAKLAGVDGDKLIADIKAAKKPDGDGGKKTDPVSEEILKLRKELDELRAERQEQSMSTLEEYGQERIAAAVEKPEIKALLDRYRKQVAGESDAEERVQKVRDFLTAQLFTHANTNIQEAWGKTSDPAKNFGRKNIDAAVASAIESVVGTGNLLISDSRGMGAGASRGWASRNPDEFKIPDKGADGRIDPAQLKSANAGFFAALAAKTARSATDTVA